MSYVIKLDRQALKAMKKLDQATVKRLRDRIKELSINPYEPRISKLITMAEGRRSSRVGEWRIIYQVNEADKIVFVAAICPRGKAYEKIRPKD